MNDFSDVQFTDTSVSDSWIKVLLYGGSGAGKTTILGTLSTMLIVSAERGTKSIRSKNLPVATIKGQAGLEQIINGARGGTFSGWGCTALGIDSLTEIAEVLLIEKKLEYKDPRQAYGATQDVMLQFVRELRDLEGMDVFATAKQDTVADSEGSLLFGPAMPGKKLGPALPYFFDGVWVARVMGSGTSRQYKIQTGSDFQYSAKDRSGTLAEFEEPDLPQIINKIRRS